VSGGSDEKKLFKALFKSRYFHTEIERGFSHLKKWRK